MQEVVENLVDDTKNKNYAYIDVILKNNDSFSIYRPNIDVNTISVDGTIFKWTQIGRNDGCVYTHYIDIGEIAYIVGITDCPAIQGGE